ncbi:hypothetical protein HGRIS_002897 [Hohenbuehelia grisea]|uniref:F-box domain-containing protein n=1 Tax=Hohenbuehelia grisea TaxID=104357 RepID=A0ABR3JN72_9AGAR
MEERETSDNRRSPAPEVEILKSALSTDSVPQEILRMILDYSLPPEYLLDHSLACGPKSPWACALRQKKSNVSVCKSWYSARIEFLYRDVVLRRMNQAESFLQAILTRSRALSELPRQLFVHFPPLIGLPEFPEQEQESQRRRIQSYIDTIIQTCPCLSCIGLSPALFSSQSFTLVHHRDITRLVLGNGNGINIFKAIPLFSDTCRFLTSLSFYAHELSDIPTDLHFTNLVTLHLKTQPSSIGYLLEIVIHWKMRKLQHLTVQHESLGFAREPLRRFLARRGRNLRTLSFNPVAFASRSVSSPQDIAMQTMLDSCPSLEHLVIYTIPQAKLSHPSIKWLDIWLCETYPSVPSKADLGDRLPSLQLVRILDTALSELTDLPILIPPKACIDGDSEVTLTFSYPGLDIRYANGHLWRADAKLWENEDDEIAGIE